MLRRTSLAALWTPLFVALLGAPVASHAAAPNSPRDLPERRVTLRFIREPLQRVVPELARQAQQQLEVGRDLREQKAILILRDQPAGEVMRRIAQVFGARWVPVDDPDHQQRLRLEWDPEVQKWLAFRKRERAQAEQCARDAQARHVREILDEAIAHVDDPKYEGIWDRDMVRFFKTLPSDVLDRVARHYGDIAAVGPGQWNMTAPPAVPLRYDQMTPVQQQALMKALTDNTQFKDRGPAGLADVLAQTPITIRPMYGSFGGDVSLEFIEPPGPGRGKGYRPALLALSRGAWPGQALGRLRDEELARRLAAKPMPEGALLGAKLGPDNKPAPPVKLDAEIGKRAVKLKEAAPLRWQFLEQIASVLELNVIADHYTLDKRLNEAASTAEPLLTRAADAYSTVFRQQGAFLLARRAVWPDDDAAEVAWPLPEQWIARKENKEPLYLDDIAALAALDDVPFYTLAAYDDGRVAFNEVKRLGEAHDRTRQERLFLALYAGLSHAQKRQTRTKTGLPFASLPSTARQILLNRVQVAAPNALRRTRLRVLGDQDKELEPYLFEGMPRPVTALGLFASARDKAAVSVPDDQAQAWTWRVRFNNADAPYAVLVSVTGMEPASAEQARPEGATRNTAQTK